MFIERSAGRIRLVRTAFVVLGLLPCAALVGWAAHLRSAAHRDAIRGRWQQAVGLPLEVGAVDHPRPGVLRARGCAVLAATGGRLLELPTLELESAAAEDRLRIDVAQVDAAAAATLATLAGEWLRGHARHPRNCVIEVADFAWNGPARERGDAAARPASAALRVECVAQDGSRAIRVVRRAAAGDEDEARIVRMVADGVERTTVEVAWSEAVPLAILAALAGADSGAVAAAGTSAFAAGELRAECDERGWNGSASGRVEGVDLAECAAALSSRASGAATISIDRIAWRDGRVHEATIACAAGPGWVDPPLLDRMVIALGCRPGPATPRDAASSVRSFDSARCVIRLVDGQVAILPADDAPDRIASAAGVPVLAPPPRPVSSERLAWMLSPPAAAFVPAAGPGAWLMSVLPASEPPTATGHDDSRSGTSSPREGRIDF
jgi:hypothetical protein